MLVWSTKSQSQPAKVGHHTDYVKKLHLFSKTSWVASGGLDQKINIWDLNVLSQSPAVSFSNNNSSNGSIYALSGDQMGNMIVSGSPDKIVRLWDPRKSAMTHQLIGHTDAIRDLLMSQDGKWVIFINQDFICVFRWYY